MLRSATFLGYWQARGYVVVSINIRLWPLASYADQCTDVAAAIGWVRANVSRYRGSPSRLVLMGHSSGSHLVSLVGTDPAYLGGQGLKLTDLQAVISSDIMAYDVPRAIQTAVQLGSPQAVDSLHRVIGTRMSDQLHGSPVDHVRVGRQYPRFLLLHAPDFHGQRQRLTADQADHFAAVLTSAGAKATAEGFADQSHATLVSDLGVRGHGPTETVDRFLGISENPQSLEDRVDAAVRSLVDPTGRRSNTAPGLVVAALTPSDAGVFGYGVERLTAKRAPDRDTLFAIASVTKSLVGLVIADEVGPRLSVDEPVNRLLRSDLRLPGPFGGDVTLRHLLTHRSGLPHMAVNLVDRDGDGRRDPGIDPMNPSQGYSRSDFSRGLRAQPLQSSPGARYLYSNVGAGLLALALQDRLRFRSFDSLLYSRVAAPLGLRSTRAASALSPRTVPAQGYAPTPSGLSPAPLPSQGSLAGAGEVVTTGRDMLTLLRCLTGQRQGPLSRAARELAKPLGSIKGSTTSGYAIEIDSSGQLSKSGSCVGYTAFLCYRRSPAVGVVILANRGSLGEVLTAGRELTAALAAQAQDETR